MTKPNLVRFALLSSCAFGLALHAGSTETSPTAGSAVSLNPVVVTGTLTARPLLDTPVRTQLVLREDVVASGARNLGDAIALLPGVRVENDCQNCNESNLRLCGLERDYVAVLFDGQPLLSSLAGIYGLDQIPAQVYDRFEIVKGGASALYGPGAVGGVINIIPRTPARTGATVSTTIEFTRGQPARRVSLGGDAVSANRRTTLTAFGDYQHIAAVDIDGDGYTEVDRRRLAVAGLRFVRTFPAGQLVADYTHAAENRRGGNALELPAHLANIAEQLDTQRDFGGLTWTARPQADLDWRLTGFFAFTRRLSYYGGLGDPAVPNTPAGVYDPAVARARALMFYGRTTNPAGYLSGRLDWTRQDHVVTAGFQLRREHIDDRTDNPLFVPLDESFGTDGVFLQDDWQIGSAWELIYGARLDRSSVLSRPILSPRAALKYAPSEKLALRAALSTGYRAPEVFADDLHSENVGGTPVQTRNAPGLARENSFSTSLDVDYLPDFAGGRLRLEAVLFFTRLRNSFATTRVELAPGHFVNLRTNTSGSAIYGLELNAAWQFSTASRLDVGLVRQEAPFDEPQEDFGNTTRLKTPRLDAVAQFTRRLGAPGTLFLSAKYTGPMLVGRRPDIYDPARNEIRRSPSFLDLSLSLARSIDLTANRQLTVTAGVKNLLDVYQRDLERGPSCDNDYVYGPRLPRTLFARLDVRF